MSYVPKVTVLLPVYNTEKFVRQAIESILGQTFTDFELLIIDDASSDNTLRIVKLFSDPRIRIIENKQNLKLAKTLNIGLKEARGEYVARMDDDDIAISERFEKQIAYLDSQVDISLAGTAITFIDEDGEFGSSREVPQTSVGTAYELMYGNPIFHSSIMFRKSDIISIGGYDESFDYAQEYDLYIRLLESGYKVANINQVLMYFRKRLNSALSSPSSQSIIRQNSLKTSLRAMNFATNIDENEFERSKDLLIVKRPIRRFSFRFLIDCLSLHKRLLYRFIQGKKLSLKERHEIMKYYKWRKKIIWRRFLASRFSQSLS